MSSDNEAACTQSSGTCSTCRAGCTHKPGWFMPGEAEKVATHLGITMQELFETKLGIDWWEDDDRLPLTFVLAPATTDMDAGEEYPSDPRGTCVFLSSDSRCTIHEVKPYECATYWCGEEDEVPKTHLAVAAAWGSHQEELTKLNGSGPIASEYGGGIFGMLDW